MSAGILSAEAATDPGLQELRNCMQLLLSELGSINQKLSALRSHDDQTRPLTAKELCERWHVEAETDELRLLYLSRKCRAWGLKPLQGGRGWNALYQRADVMHAENFANGSLKRRKHAA